jgi:hypothetical protein
MNFWNHILEHRNRKTLEATELARKRAGQEALALEYVERAEQIPIPAQQRHRSLNQLGTALHYFAVGLRAAPLSKKNLPLYRASLVWIDNVLELWQSSRPDLVPMLVARCRVLSSVLDILESRMSVTDVILPSPEQIALWACGASSGQILMQDKKLEDARSALRHSTKTYLRENGFQWLGHLVTKFKNESEDVRGEMFKAMCEAIDEALPTTKTPYDSWYGLSAIRPVSQRQSHGEELGRLMTICVMNWVETDLSSPKRIVSATVF